MLTFRPAIPADGGTLLAWRNDPDSRAASASQGEIARETHDRWFAGSLASSSRWIFFAIDNESGDPIGMTRFDLGDDRESAEVSINLAPGWRGRGLSGQVLAGGIAAFREIHGAPLALTATIRPTNAASARVFTRAGFLKTTQGRPLDLYVLAPLAGAGARGV